MTDLVLFSPQGVHYRSRGKGAMVGMMVPADGSERTLSGIDIESPKAVADHYGSDGKPVVYEKKNGQAVVYGTVLDELLTDKNSLQVFLPQQFLPKETDAFYYVLGERWIVLGDQTQDEDKQWQWRLSKIKVTEDGMVADMVLRSVGETMLRGGDKKLIVRVAHNPKALQKLQKSLDPFNVVVEDFEKGRKAQKAKPLYKHHNYSLLMGMVLLFAAGVLGYVGLNWLEARQREETVTQNMRLVENQIRQITKNENLENINNPEAVIAEMSESLYQAPSAVLNVAAQVGGRYGDVMQVILGVSDIVPEGQVGGQREFDVPNQTNLRARVDVKPQEGLLLVDQERIAQAVLGERPWVRRIQNVSNPTARKLTLDILLRTQTGQEEGK